MLAIQAIQNPLEKSFREGLARGQLLLPVCSHCQQTHWYPRAHCPHCGQSVSEVQPACGVGEIYACTLLYAKDKEPQCIAYVSLQEGVTVLANLSCQSLSVPMTPTLIGKEVRLSPLATQRAGELVFELLEPMESVRNDGDGR